MPPDHSLPLSTLSTSAHARNPSLLPPDHFLDIESAASSSDLVHLSRGSSRQPSPYSRGAGGAGAGDGQPAEEDSDFEHWGSEPAEDEDMPTDLRRPSLRLSHHEVHAPLLSNDKHQSRSSLPALTGRRSARFRERDADPEVRAKAATRKRYTYAACFLAVSLVSFAVQTETAVYIQHNLGWKKAYCML